MNGIVIIDKKALGQIKKWLFDSMNVVAWPNVNGSNPRIERGLIGASLAKYYLLNYKANNYKTGVKLKSENVNQSIKEIDLVIKLINGTAISKNFEDVKEKCRLADTHLSNAIFLLKA